MGKDSSEKKVKDKKEKKEKRAEVDGVKKSRKEKKEKKLKVNGDIADALEAELEKAPEESLVRVVETVVAEEPRGALVPFACPLAEDAKEVKKILRTVKKCKLARRRPSFNCVGMWTLTVSSSRQNEDAAPRRKRGRESPPQIADNGSCQLRHFKRDGCCYHCSRHLSHGRHLAHPCPLRRP